MTRHLIGLAAVAATIVSITLAGCNSTSPPETGTVHGTLILKGSSARPDTGTVQVSLFASWDTTYGLSTHAPGGPPSYATESLPHGEMGYRIENITFGRYEALAVSWRDTTRYGEAATSTIGAYGADPTASDTTPAAIVFSEDDAEYELDLVINYDLIVPPPTSGTISGTLTLNGTWPTGTVYLFVVSQATPGPAFQPMGMPAAMLTVDQFTGTAAYTIENVPFGTYGLVGAYDVTGTYPNLSYRFIGGYGVTNPATDTPTSVTLSESAAEITGANFTVSP